MKKYNFLFVTLLSIVIILFLLSGCGTVEHSYDKDYTVKYKNFLDYSLGNWEITQSQNENQTIDNTFNISKYYWKSWDIEYTDEYGSNQVLHLSNRETLTENLEQHISEVYMKTLHRKNEKHS